MKKNYINHLAAIVCCVFSLIACSDKALQQDKVDGDMIILPFGDIELHPLGQKVSMPFTCSSSWSVETDKEKPDWLTVEPSSGEAGTTQITITASPNVGSKDRSVTLKFPGKDLVVEQQRTVLSVDKSAFDDAEKQAFVLGWQASNRELNVESNIKWTFRLEDVVDDYDDYDWVQTESDTKKVYGKNKVISDEPLKFNMPDNNIGSSVHTASIVVIPLDIDGKELSDEELRNSLTKKINIEQDYLYFKLISENLKSFDYLGSDYVNSREDEEFKNKHTDCIQTLCVESEADWTIVDETAANDKGIYFSRSEDGKVESVTDKTVKKWNLNIDWRTANPDRDDREYTQKIKVTPEKGEGKELAIDLKQLGYVFSVELEDNKSQFKNNDSDQTITVKIQTDGPWALENESSWLDPGTGLKGEGNATVNFKTKGQNLNFEDNKSTVKFSTAGLNQLQKPIEFSQDKFKFDITLEKNDNDNDNDNTMHLTRLDLSEHKVNVVSSGPWKVELLDKGKEYMNCSSYAGEAGNTSFGFNFKKTNNDTSDHPVDITVYSTQHKDNLVEGQSKKTFRIVHDPYFFQVQRSESDERDFETDTFKAYQAGSQSFYLKCSAPWKIIVDDDDKNWLSVDKTEGDGVSYTPISITAGNNTGKDWQQSRTGRLTILSDRYGTGIESQMERKTIDISQEEFKFNVTCNASYGGTMLPAVDTKENSMIRINIESSDNAAWKITGGEWAIPEEPDGNGSKNVKVYSKDNNYGFKIRHDVLEVTSVPLDITKSFNIYQDKYVFEPSPITVNEFPELNASSQPITLKCTGNWTIDYPDWLTVTANGEKVPSGSGSKGNADFELKANNNSGKSRSGEFVIKSGGVHVKKYSVSQAGYLWTVTPADDFMGLSEMTGGVKEYTVESSGSWEATSSNSAHVQVSTTNTGGGRGVVGVVTVTVKPNYTLEPVNATVTVRSKDFPSKVEQINISQNAYKWSVGDPDVSTFNADGATNNTAKVSIKECSGSWKADSSAGWLKLDKAEGNGGDTIVVTVKDANADTADRKATLTITSKDNSALKKVIEFIQKGTPPKEE